MSSYYDRRSIVHLDGTRVFQSEADRQNEREIASTLEKTWGCRIAAFGALSPIDWYAERHGRLVGLLELKSRHHAHDIYEGAFLNVRKWLALSLGAVGLGCPAIFVVRYDNAVYWTPIASIDATNHRIAGCSRIVKSENDIEPVVYVPVAAMTRLHIPELAAA